MRIIRFALAAALALLALPASAFAAVPGTTASVSAPAFVNGTSDTVTYSATTGNTGGTVFIWARVQASPPGSWICADVGNTLGPNSSSSNNSKSVSGLSTSLSNPADGSTIEWLATVEDDTGGTGTCSDTTGPSPVVTPPSSTVSAQATSTLDKTSPTGFVAAPPATASGNVACTSFELFGVAKDTGVKPSGIESFSITANGSVSGFTASGITPRQASTPGPTVTPTARIFTFPTGATGNWTFDGTAKDVAGNTGVATSFLSLSNVQSLSACTSYPDLTGDGFPATYARYLSTNTTNTPALFQGLPAPSGSGTIFGPDATMTRAMLAKVLVSAVEPGVTLPTSAPSGCSFTDVPTGQWYTGYVWEACRIGLMQGVGGGLFDPNGALTRGQAATAIDRLNTAANGGYLSNNSVVKASGVAIRGTPSFTDVPVGAFYATAVQDLYARDVIDGTSATTFSPDATLTRGQLAKILYRALAQATPIQ
ncbi:MAG: S-layer homology domain-containing protein [Chloroflexi bacterium]|nr:S-layer homology domain-containing protein [Chloroflexota bacterium]